MSFRLTDLSPETIRRVDRPIRIRKISAAMVDETYSPYGGTNPREQDRISLEVDGEKIFDRVPVHAIWVEMWDPPTNVAFVRKEIRIQRETTTRSNYSIVVVLEVERCG